MSDSSTTLDGLRPVFLGRLADGLSILLPLGAIGWALQAYRRIGLEIYDHQYLAAMLAITLALAYLRLPADRDKRRTIIPWYDIILSLAGFLVAGYVAYDYPRLADEIFTRPADGVAAGLILLILTLEALRRAVGHVLFGIILVFLLYALYAEHIPGSLAGRANDWQKLSMYLTVNAILGLPIKVAATIVIAFVLFGHLLNRTGGSSFFTEIALSLMGRFRGGAAKIAVFASALFGSVSGSAVANVVSTGVVTIPLMKRGGYPAHQAGAIEAVASTGGQLMPPVMGAAAFLIAEFLEIPYGDVVLAALIPGLLYYIALFIQADLVAARDNLQSVAPDQIPPLGRVLRDGWYFPLPFVILMVALFWWNLQPETAVMWSILTLLAAVFLFGFRGERPHPGRLLRVMRTTGDASIDLILICAAAGIVIGVLDVSGLGFNLTSLLVDVGEGNLWLLLALSAAVCIILGMGLPTVGVYVLLAALVAPALVEMEVKPIAAHLYVMYFGLMSMITPPIAIAAYAAATVAESDPMKTGWAALRFGWPAFLMPVLFVVSPSLLMIGDGWHVAGAFVTAVAGVWFISIAVIGYLNARLNAAMRLVYLASGLAAVIPSSAFPGAWISDLLGLAVGLALVGYSFAQRKNRTLGNNPS